MIVQTQRRRRGLGQLSLPDDINLNWSNAITGRLTPAQVAALQQQAVANNNQVLQNAIDAYGPDSPAVLAIQGVIDSQNAATVADIGALNPYPIDLSDPTTWPWYYWLIGGGVALLLIYEIPK
jgi:hypothetical protein